MPFEVEVMESSVSMPTATVNAVAVGPLNVYPDRNQTIIGASVTENTAGSFGYLTTGTTMRADLIEGRGTPAALSVTTFDGAFAAVFGGTIHHDVVLPLTTGSAGGTATPPRMERDITLPTRQIEGPLWVLFLFSNDSGATQIYRCLVRIKREW